MSFLPRTSAASHCVLPLKGRLILAFLRALVGAFKAGKIFVPRKGPPTGPAQGILWLGRHALQVDGAVTSRALRGAGPAADISTLFGRWRVDAAS